MAKSRLDIKEILVFIAIVLVGAAFTAASLCVYYLVQPQNTALLIALCVADFLYLLFCSCWLAKQVSVFGKWLLKGILLAVIYIVAFIAVPTLYLLISGAIELLQNNIIGIVYYAFFTGPCIITVLAIIPLICMGL